MHKNLIRTSYKDMTHDEWLAFRRGSIGGSDAAAIIGLSPWATPYSVWADKLGMTAPLEDNEAMRLGRDLEDYAAKRWCEKTGKKVRRENSFIVNPAYPWAHATVDRLVVGEDEGLECKVTSSRLALKKYKQGEFPENYYCQCVHYLGVTGAKRWNLTVLVLGVGVFDFVIERDEDEINALMTEEAHFWEGFVAPKVAPPVDGYTATTEALSEVYSDGGGEEVDVTLYDQLLDEYALLGEQIGQLGARRDEISNRLKEYLGNAEQGSSGRYRVSWKVRSRSSFDNKAFSADHPGEDLSRYFKTTTYRAFKVTEIETEN